MEKVKVNTTGTRWWDLPAAVILLVVMTTAFSRLVATEWTQGLVVTRYITYLGLFAGLAIGQSRFSAKIAAFLAFAYGLFIIPWRLGMLMGEGILWDERLISMGGRLQVIITQLTKRQAVTDSFLFLVLMGVLFWVLSIHAGYTLTRYANPWRIIIPAGVAMVLIHSYDAYLSSRAWYLVVFLFFSLILVARLAYLHNRSRWAKTNTYIPPYIGVDFVRIALVATVALLLLSWTTPALADSLPQAQDVWTRLKQPWNEMRNTMDNAFASLRSTVGIVSDFYGPNLSLGRGTQLTDRQVFTVLAPDELPEGARLYWKARNYDSYEGGWSSTLLATELVDSNTFDFDFPDFEDNAPGLYPFTFRSASPLSTLLTPHQAVWVSRPVKLELEYNDSGEADLATIRATPPIRAGEQYDVRSSLNSISIAALKNAGTGYPDWVTEKYLQLPETITPRTRALASQLAAGKETPYDIVIAVTNYLRQNIEYSETIPALPNDQELVDWFLFDFKQGFCNYYATAEIVLLRAVGIPARLAVGYAQGEPVEGTNAYIVLQRDSHAWPEVYFPGIGWVEFEPTVSQPAITRPAGETSSSGPDPGSIPNQPELDRGDNFDDPRLRELEAADQAAARAATTRAIGTGGAIIGLFVVLVIITLPLIRRKRLYERIPNIPITLENSLRRIGLQPPAFLLEWARRARLSPLARYYHEINSALKRLGKNPALTETPAERVASLETELPPAGSPAHRLLDEYQTATYSQGYQPDMNIAQQTSREIRAISYRAWFQRLLSGRGDNKPDARRS